MKLLVPTKRVPNPDQPIRVRPDGTGIDDSETSFVINPFDAIALEEALRIRERQTVLACEVVAISIGGTECANELRTALAMGADRAIRIACDEQLDPWNVAKLLTAMARRENPDLVLMGKQAIDDDSNQVGQMIAGLLDWPQATFASRLEFVDGNKLKISRETDLGLEVVMIRMPAVVTADLRLNEPRYASLPAMIKAKKRPIEDISIQELGETIEPKLRVVRLEGSAIKRTCIRVNDAADLVSRLRYEAKVI